MQNICYGTQNIFQYTVQTGAGIRNLIFVH